MRKIKASSIMEAVKIVFLRYPLNYEFFGSELKRDVARIYPKCKNCYVDTVLRRLRSLRKGKFNPVPCIKPTVSLYKKVANL
jgi:hypothetical protein